MIGQLRTGRPKNEPDDGLLNNRPDDGLFRKESTPLLTVCLAFVLAATLAPEQADASAWAGESHGTFCAGSSCDNTAPNAPTTTAGRVLLIYSIHVGSSSATLSTPMGWTRIDPTTLDADSEFNTRVFCKVAAGGDTMPTLNWSSSGDTIITQAVSFSGPTAPDCSTIVHASGATKTTGSVTFFSQSLTITHGNTLVFEVGAKLQDGSPLDYGSIACPSDVNTGQFANDSSISAFFPQSAGCYRVETTASSVSSSHPFLPADTEGGDSIALALSLESQQSSAPSFSVLPTYATVSNTQISATFTADSAGEIYYCGLWAKGATPPADGAAVAAGTGAHSAIITGSTTGSSETHNITTSDSPSHPSYDPYCVLFN